MKYRFLAQIIVKSIYIISSCFFLISCADDESLDLLNPEEKNLLTFPNYQTELIENQFIIVFNEDQISFKVNLEDYEGTQALMRKEAADFLSKHRIDPNGIEYIYSMALSGFSARIDQSKVNDIINDPKVKYIEQDRKGELGIGISKTNDKEVEEEMENTQIVPWGINRVGGPFKYQGRHSVFVVDTGIDLLHLDLNVDLDKGFDPYNQKRKDWNLNDEHGHGTHVAGTIGALDNHFGVVGVAAGVPVVPVKVFFGPRAAYTYSGLVAGIEHIGVRGIPGDVANLSFGGFDASQVLDDAVLNVSNKRRVWMVIASGNSKLPAYSFSPARVNGSYTITVSAIRQGDFFAGFSHYGPPIKYAAPGVGVLSTWTNNRYRNESGTSMAAPHVAALRVLGEIDTNGFVLNYPTPNPDPIAFRKSN
ncbi:S8 family serine peptidase [Shivajiella indica]|uniref:S8 family serine peptidase n=1 Tax=Shivajiella indica TaxID=872115 RepID=A0ABW5B7R7_9BACT